MSGHWIGLALLGGLVAGPAPSAPPKLPAFDDPPITDAERAHWAFQPPRRPLVPSVPGAKSEIRNPIDLFVLARLRQKGLGFAPQADRQTLIRRVTFDLAGLPPKPEEIDAFLKDTSPYAYERLVDRLLASPHYGEARARQWLDVVRYAESNGYEGDGERPHAWRYRDYVVQSFNQDKPYDQFVREQVAGDLLAAGKEPRAAAELWVATGMHRCGPVHVVGGNTDREVLRQEMLTEMVQGVGAAFLGLTMNCARCHDHKFDPISQGDYYRLEAFFAGTRPREVDFSLPGERAEYQKKASAINARLAPIKSQVADIDTPHRKRLAAAKRAALEPKYRDALTADPNKRTPEQDQLVKDAQPLLKVTWDEILADLSPEEAERRAALRARQHALEAELPPTPGQAWAVSDEAVPPPTFVLKRGDVKRKVALVQPGVLRVVGKAARPSPTARATRLDLANWLTRPDHPLTARVFVNRLWQHHFGRGIVATPNDFGTRGEAPTHPELLDWLATDFVDHGWKVKRMDRMMVLSQTYRQASALRVTDCGLRISAPLPFAEAAGSVVFANPQPATRNPQLIDPNNKLLWQMNRRRLEAEPLRDAMLAAAGTLNPEVGGPMVRVPLEPEVYDLIFTEGERDGLWRTTPDAKQHTRRSLYLFAKRNVRLPLLEAFDQPDRLSPCAARAVSTFAPQALILMNGPFAQSQSRAFAARLVCGCGTDRERQIELAYRRAFGRLPREAERALAREFLDRQTETVRDRMRAMLPVGIPDGLSEGADLAAAAALSDFCLALFNANEFLYVR